MHGTGRGRARRSWTAFVLCALGTLMPACKEGPAAPEPEGVVREGDVTWTVHGLTREPGCGLGSVRACLFNTGDLDLEVTERRFESGAAWQLLGPTPPFVLAADEEACFEGRVGPTRQRVWAELSVEVTGLEAPLTAVLDAPPCVRDPRPPAGVVLSTDTFGADAVCGVHEGETCLVNGGPEALTVTQAEFTGERGWQVLQAPEIPAILQPGERACARLRLEEPDPDVREAALAWTVAELDAPVVASLGRSCSILFDVAFPAEPPSWTQLSCGELQGRVCLRNDAPTALPGAYARVVETHDGGVVSDASWSIPGSHLSRIGPGQTECFTVTSLGPNPPRPAVEVMVAGTSELLSSGWLELPAPTAPVRVDRFELPDPPAFDVVWVVDDDPALAAAVSPTEVATALVTAYEGTDTRVVVVSSDPAEAGAPVDPSGYGAFVSLEAPAAASDLAARLTALGSSGTDNQPVLKAFQALTRLGQPTASDESERLRAGVPVVLLFTTASDDAGASDPARLWPALQGALPPDLALALRVDLLAGRGGDADCMEVVTPRLTELVALTRGDSGSLCAASLRPGGADPTRVRGFHPTRTPADPTQIVVSLVLPDDSRIPVPPDTWRWEPATGAVLLDPAWSPAAGDRVELSYAVDCTEVP